MKFNTFGHLPLSVFATMFASATVASDGNITTNTLSSAATTWDMPRLQQEFVGDDPWQSFNRSMFALDEAMMTYVARPLSTLYSSLVPRPVIKGVERAYLDRTLGDRITWFSSGAHCGMFHTPEFREEVLNRLDLQVCGE